MTYAPDPTYAPPHLGWTEQNKHGTRQDAPVTGAVTVAPDTAAAAPEPGPRSRSSRRKK